MNQTVNNLTVTGKIIFPDSTFLESSYASLFSNFLNFSRNASSGQTTLLSDTFIVSNKIQTPNLQTDVTSSKFIKFVDDLDATGTIKTQKRAFTDTIYQDVLTTITDVNNLKSTMDSIVPDMVYPATKRLRTLNGENLAQMTPTSIQITDGESVCTMTPTAININGVNVESYGLSLAIKDWTQLALQVGNDSVVDVSTSSLSISLPINTTKSLSFSSAVPTNRTISNVTTINFKDASGTSPIFSINYDSTNPSLYGGATYYTRNLGGAHNFQLLNASAVSSIPFSIRSDVTAIRNTLLITNPLSATDSNNRCEITSVLSGNNHLLSFNSKCATNGGLGSIEFRCNRRDSAGVNTENTVCTIGPYGFYVNKALEFYYTDSDKPFFTAHGAADLGPSITQIGGASGFLPLSGVILNSSTSVQNVKSFQINRSGVYEIKWKIRMTLQTGTSSTATKLRYGISLAASNTLDTFTEQAVSNVDVTDLYKNLTDLTVIEIPTSCIARVNSGGWVYCNCLVTFSPQQLNVGGIVTYTRIG